MLIGAGYTDDVLEYIRVSVPKNMLADLKDSVKQGRSLNLQDKYGATAVSPPHTCTPSIHRVPVTLQAKNKHKPGFFKKFFRGSKPMF